MERFIRRFYDSHPQLPLDPDSDQLKIVRPIHTDSAHIVLVGMGAFFGTLARYQIGEWLPAEKDGWPMATFLINVVGAFLLGLLLQVLLQHGKDEGGRRILRITFGTGFMGAFTTYSSLATSVAVLSRDNHILLAVLYGGVSVLLGIGAGALGIGIATHRHKRRII